MNHLHLTARDSLVGRSSLQSVEHEHNSKLAEESNSISNVEAQKVDDDYKHGEEYGLRDDLEFYYYRGVA